MGANTPVLNEFIDHCSAYIKLASDTADPLTHFEMRQLAIDAELEQGIIERLGKKMLNCQFINISNMSQTNNHNRVVLSEMLSKVLRNISYDSTYQSLTTIKIDQFGGDHTIGAKVLEEMRRNPKLYAIKEIRLQENSDWWKDDDNENVKRLADVLENQKQLKDIWLGFNN